MVRYVEGDATLPQPRPALIVHVCNDVGAWAAGFVVALSKRYREPEKAYRGITPGERVLGAVQFVAIGDGSVTVANMIAQAGITRLAGPPISYPALEISLTRVADFARKGRFSIHMPRIGCGLGGGRWGSVEPIIERTLDGLDVTVYDLKR